MSYRSFKHLKKKLSFKTLQSKLIIIKKIRIIYNFILLSYKNKKYGNKKNDNKILKLLISFYFYLLNFRIINDISFNRQNFNSNLDFILDEIKKINKLDNEQTNQYQKLLH